jgi:site-specific recombinase XerD
MDNCIKCKAELPPGALFCPACGKKQTADTRKHRKRANGTGNISKQSGNRSKPWLARKNGVPIGTYTTRAEAQKALERLTDATVTDKFNLTLKQIYDIWFPEYTRGDEKPEKSHYAMAINLCKELHDQPMRKLRRSDFQSVIIQLEQAGKSKSTCQKVILLFKQLSNWAIEEGILQTSHAQKVTTIAEQLSTREIFLDSHIKAIQASTLEARKIALILLGCGCRPNELFKVPLINCHEDYFVGGSKTKAGRNRVIIVTGVGLEAYQELRQKAIREKRQYLIEAYEGNHVAANYTKRDFAELMKEIGCKGMTPYCCRHTFITNAVRSGVKQEILQKLVGHVDSETTEGYTHLLVDDLREEVSKISTSFAVCSKSATRSASQKNSARKSS